MSTWGQRGLSRGVRRRVLERDEGRCMLGYPGCLGVASEIDDIVPVSVLGLPREELTDDNRQAVCSHCHHIKTEQHKLTRIRESTEARRARRKLPKKPHPGEW